MKPKTERNAWIKKRVEELQQTTELSPLEIANQAIQEYEVVFQENLEGQEFVIAQSLKHDSNQEEISSAVFTGSETDALNLLKASAEARVNRLGRGFIEAQSNLTAAKNNHTRWVAVKTKLEGSEHYEDTAIQEELALNLSESQALVLRAKEDLKSAVRSDNYQAFLESQKRLTAINNVVGRVGYSRE